MIFYAALMNSGDPIFSPKITLTITNADESTTYGSCSFWFGAASSGGTNDTPDEFGYGEFELSGVPASTTVYGKFTETECARLISATVYEEALSITSANGYVVPSALPVGSPILDARRQDLYELARNLWTDGAAHLFNWSADNQASPQTATGTAKNLVDGSTSAASGPAWRLDTRYCGTRARSTTVPCLLAVRAKMSGTSDSGEVVLSGVSGGSIGTVVVSGATEQWYTATVSLPADLDDYYVAFSNPDFGTGAGETLSVYAASLFQLA